MPARYLVLSLALSATAVGCADAEPTARPAQVTATLSDRQGNPGPLGDIEGAHYDILLGSYEEMDDLLVEAEWRRAEALRLLESKGEAGEPFRRILASSGVTLAKAARAHSAAAPHVERVAAAVDSGKKRSATEDSYQAVHNAVTRAGHVVLGMKSMISNCADLCVSREASGRGECEPEVLSIVQPVIDLEALAKATLP